MKQNIANAVELEKLLEQMIHDAKQKGNFKLETDISKAYALMIRRANTFAQAEYYFLKMKQLGLPITNYPNVCYFWQYVRQEEFDWDRRDEK